MSTMINTNVFSRLSRDCSGMPVIMVSPVPAKDCGASA